MIPHVEREYHNYVGKQMIFKKKIKKKKINERQGANLLHKI